MVHPPNYNGENDAGSPIFFLDKWKDLVAQLVEHNTFEKLELCIERYIENPP